jgi:hypothetical protein
MTKVGLWQVYVVIEFYKGQHLMVMQQEFDCEILAVYILRSLSSVWMINLVKNTGWRVFRDGSAKHRLVQQRINPAM